jgi:hypothetical protein
VAEKWNIYEAPHRRKQSFASAVWAASHVLGVVAIGIAAIGVLVAALAARSPLSGVLGSVIPNFISDIFSNPDAISPTLPKGITELAAEAAPTPVKRRSSTATFTIGSSEETVLRCQGRPSRISGGAWFYGDSEVHFVAGRVISWRNSSKNPLKVQ